MATPKSPITVTITGAAGQIAYSLLFAVGKGDVFGLDQPIILKLLDIGIMETALSGVVMELEDCSFPLIAEIVPTTDPEVAFKDSDVAILVGAIPRREGMERKDLLAKNAEIFKVQGEVLNRVAKKTVKVLVVGNPANTNALITSRFAPSIPPQQFTCLTQLDQNRARGFIARRVGVSPLQVRNVIIWGNHSSTQYPDVQHAYIVNGDGSRVSVKEAVNDDAWLCGDFVMEVQKRGGAVIQARKLSSALSAAKAIADHMRVWWNGTGEGEMTSMGVMSDGSYGVRPGVYYSHPVTIKDGAISIVSDLKIDEFSRQKMNATSEELFQEREMALGIVA